MKQSTLLFWEVTCQNPCSGAGVILRATEPNQLEKYLAAYLPGPLASLSGPHFCLEHNITALPALCRDLLFLSYPSSETVSENMI